jgi:hypothetical protein
LKKKKMEKDRFEKLLKEQLGNHEMPVDPALWKKVAAQAGISTGSAGLGLGGWLGIAGGVALLTAGLFYFSAPKKGLSKPATKIQEQKTKVNVPVEAENELSNVKSGFEYAPPVVTMNPTEPVIHCSGGDVSVVLMTEKTQESLVLQDDQVAEIPHTSDRDPLASVQTPSSSTTQEVSKQEAWVESTVENAKPKILVMPNAITPNGDGVNDALTLNAEGLIDFSVVVLDASNKVVFSSTDPGFVWKGLLPNGDPVPAGIYQYYYTAKDANGRWCNQFSLLSVLR